MLHLPVFAPLLKCFHGKDLTDWYKKDEKTVAIDGIVNQASVSWWAADDTSSQAVRSFRHFKYRRAPEPQHGFYNINRFDPTNFSRDLDDSLTIVP